MFDYTLLTNLNLIRNIFLKNRIVVKPDSRHCNRHFFNSDYLSEKELNSIQTYEKQYDENIIKMFDILSNINKQLPCADTIQILQNTTMVKKL